METDRGCGISLLLYKCSLLGTKVVINFCSLCYKIFTSNRRVTVQLLCTVTLFIAHHSGQEKYVCVDFRVLKTLLSCLNDPHTSSYKD